MVDAKREVEELLAARDQSTTASRPSCGRSCACSSRCGPPVSRCRPVPATTVAAPFLIRQSPQKERQGQSWQIGINYLTSEEPLWLALPDLIAAKILGGAVPEVLEALRLEPVGRQSGLSAVSLRGSIPVDPTKTDFFRTVIEERQRVRAQAKADGRENDPLERFLKVLANSTSYGVFAEFVRHELTGKRTEPVTVWDAEGQSFASKTHAPELPGEYCFPPLAAFITSAARLMLALLEARVERARRKLRVLRYRFDGDCGQTRTPTSSNVPADRTDLRGQAGRARLKLG